MQPGFGVAATRPWPGRGSLTHRLLLVSSDRAVGGAVVPVMAPQCLAWPRAGVMRCGRALVSPYVRNRWQLQLGCRAPTAIKRPTVVLVIRPHCNGNAQRQPRSACLGLALFSSRLCCFLCTSRGHRRGKSNGRRRPRGNSWSHPVLFGWPLLAFVWSVGLSIIWPPGGVR